MTIDESTNVLKCIKGWGGTELYDAINLLTNTARKYQKIEQIYQKWNIDFGKQDYETLRQIGEVIDNGKID